MSTIKSSSEHLTLNADGASKDIKFQANGVEKASIDSSGNVAASGTITSNGQAQLNNNNLISTNTGATGEWIGKRTSSGEGIHITTTNASGTDTQRLAITCNADSADFIVKDSDIVFGTAGKGIVLGSTTNVDANTLDDYEEGTWTVSLTGTTESLADNSGKYTKIGNVVYFTWYSGNTTLASSTGAAKINGLPFVALAGNDYSLFYYNHGNAVDGDSRGGYINAGSDSMSFIDKNSTATSSYIDGGAKYIMVSGFYYV